MRRCRGWSRETSLTPAAHLTCVGATRDEVDAVARRYWEAGVRHIVALRGDPPAGASEYTPHPGGYAQAEDLVRGLRRIGDFDISVGAYPEGHPAAVSAEADLDFLKRKIDAGANRAITQYFFDTDVYLRFLDRCLAAGITVPIVPGIMPVSNFSQVVKFSAMCGARVPAWMGKLFEGLEEDAETRRMVAAVVAAEQVRLLQANGVDEFHFYTLNRPDLTYAIAHILGARPKAGATGWGTAAAAGRGCGFRTNSHAGGGGVGFGQMAWGAARARVRATADAAARFRTSTRHLAGRWLGTDEGRVNERPHPARCGARNFIL